jgi:hypothetical protein
LGETLLGFWPLGAEQRGGVGEWSVESGMRRKRFVREEGSAVWLVGWGSERLWAKEVCAVCS